MKKVLCVCKGNTCRSPMMQVLLQKELGDKFLVEGAGTNPEAAGHPANEHTMLCMNERGYDLSAHRSRWIGDLNLNEYTAIVCVGEDEADLVRARLNEHSDTVVFVANGSVGVPNPYQKGLEAYRECLALLDEVMPDAARHIRSS